MSRAAVRRRSYAFAALTRSRRAELVVARPESLPGPPKEGGGRPRGSRSTHARRAGFGLLVALGLALATAAPSWAGYRETVLADSPAGYWRLGEASGTSAGDETANANTGTYLNGASLGTAGALSDGTTAVSLDGSNDYVNVPNSTSLNPSSGITLEAWVKPTAGGFGTGKPVIVKGYTSHVTPYYQYALIMLDSGTYPKLIQLSLTIGGALQQFNVTNSGWQYGLWNHIVATYDGATMRVYRNGTQVGSRAQTGSITSYATPVDSGCFENLSKTSTYCFKGVVDEAVVYSTALSASQIQAHYAASAVSAPENLTPPSISGTAGAGATLTASPGTWSNNPTSYSYQWRRCDNAGANCADIAGATAATYALTPADTGNTIGVGVTAANGAGTAAAAPAPQTAVVGTQLSTTTYSANTTWTVAGSPYILAGNVTVASGATLTIQPGVIVKSNDRFRELQVNGTLSAIGTASSRITFTSLQDDSMGGDSGGDGPTSGAKGQWYRVEFGSTSVSHMSYVNVRYGAYGSSNLGDGGIIVSGQSTVTVDHAEITDNKFSGIIVAGSNGHAIVERSTIARNGMGIHLLNAWLELRDGSYVTDNGTRGVDFTITTSYAGPPSTVMDSDIYANDGSGINLQLDQAVPTARVPRGHGHNIYGNGGKGLSIFYAHLDDDWSGNFWGSDAYFFFNPAVCLEQSPYSLGKLSYYGGTGNPPSGPVDSGGYVLPPPNSTFVCGYDKVLDTPFSSFYIAGHGRVPPGGSTTGLPMEQTLGSCGGGIHAVNASSCQSDPVNGATGSFVQHVTDLALPGIGLPFAFARSFNSLDTSAGALGHGWTHSYSASLTVKANGDVTLHGEDGQRVEYTKQPDGSFVGAPGARSTLVEVTGGYELTRHDQVRYAFASSGRLESMRERNGQGLTFAYAGGLLSTITDSVGRAISLSYNGSNRLTSVALPDERHVDYGYTGDGHLGSVTDVRGGTTVYTYESHGFLKTAVDPNQHTVFTNTYSNAGRVTQQLDALNKTTTFSWNATTQTQTATDARNHQWKDVYDKNVLVKRIDPLTNTTEYGYDADLNLTSVKDARLHTTTMSYDARGNLLTRTPPAPFIFDEEFSYDPQNNVLTARDGRGYTTSYGYDASGNLTSTTEPGTVVTLYGRDPTNGLLTSITDPRGKTTLFQYDADGNLERTTTPDGSVGTAVYDASGRMSSSVEARGNAPGADPDDYRTSYTHNEADQVLTVTDPLQHTTSYTYDGVGNLRTVTDAKSRTTEYRYDAADHLDKVIAPDPAVVTDYDYDGVGNLHLRTAPGNRVTTYEYDDANRLASVLTSAAQLWTYGYDENGNRSQAVDAAGNATPADPDDGKTIYGYDNLNRLTSIDYSDATPDVAFAYDGNGNRTSMTDGAGTVAYDFDSRDRLTAVTRGPDAFAYEYDDANRLTKRTYPGGRVSDYTYWDDGELQTVTSNGLTTSYAYDKAGRLTATSLPSANGYVETRAYDRAGRLATVTNARSGSTLSSASYLYDEVGNPTQVTTQDGITTYGYDLTFDRLTDVCFAAGCPNPSDPQIHYGYDPVGNRTSEVRPEGTTTYTYDANLSDELVSTSGPGGTVAYEYDADGNQTRAGTRTFSYDLAGRPVTTSEGSSTIAYSYDGDGTRLQASAGPLPADTTNYLWDPNAGLPQLALERDGSGATLRSYLLGNDSVSMDGGGQTSYFHYDGIGSVANVTSATGDTQWSYSYEPFGAARSAIQSDPQAPVNPLRFAGELYDSPTSLYQLRARQYDPADGRFLATDPLAPPATDPYVSSYVYANDRPTVLIDPSGMGSIWALWDWAKSEFTQCTQSLACTAEWGLTLVGPGKFWRVGKALWAFARIGRGGLVFHYTDEAGRIGITAKKFIFTSQETGRAYFSTTRYTSAAQAMRRSRMLGYMRCRCVGSKMGAHRTMKRPFLVEYQYGQGSVWTFMLAESPEQIERDFPELKVYRTPPKDMSKERLELIERDMTLDIDDKESDFLAALIRGRGTG